MWIVLGNVDELSALWAFEKLKESGLEPLEFISGEALACSLEWEHRVDNSRSAYSRVRLTDGRSFSSREVQGVLNRLVQLPMDHFAVAKAEDRLYATQEFTAFVLSWLTSISKVVINPPTPEGLFGRWLKPFEWAHVAAKAGLEISGNGWAHFHDLSDFARLRAAEEPVRTVLLLDGTVYGTEAPAHIRRSLRNLQRLSGSRLIGVDFAQRDGNDWVFSGATTLPDLRIGGDPFIEGLRELLEEGRT